MQLIKGKVRLFQGIDVATFCFVFFTCFLIFDSTLSVSLFLLSYTVTRIMKCALFAERRFEDLSVTARKTS